jgi:hypothetical protein
VRRECPTAWDRTLRECRAGLRRYTGADHAEHYQRILAFDGEGSWEEPDTYERTLGDLIDPTRPGRMQDVVNAVSRDVGTDTAEWGVARLLSALVPIRQEAEQRQADAGP